MNRVPAETFLWALNLTVVYNRGRRSEKSEGKAWQKLSALVHLGISWGALKSHSKAESPNHVCNLQSLEERKRSMPLLQPQDWVLGFSKPYGLSWCAFELLNHWVRTISVYWNWPVLALQLRWRVNLKVLCAFFSCFVSFTFIYDSPILGNRFGSLWEFAS